MKNEGQGQKGFTLLEIIVVLAVIGALAAILAPIAFRYVDDANRAKAQADTNTIAAGIQQMYKDTGRWPFYASGTGKLTYTSGTDSALLTSSSGCATLAAAATCDSTEPEDSSTGSTWVLATAKATSLANHLITNTPAYATTGGRAWKGPYLNDIPATDPWGRSYYVNIANADPDAEGATQKWVVVISAGPDGNLDTLADVAGTTNPTAGGDDVIARVK